MSYDERKLVEVYNEKGQPMSPKLPDGIKNFLIDIDGTICEDIPNEEPERMATVLPFPDAIRIISKWYKEGHQITFFTARTEHLRHLTEEWLAKHDIKYHFLLMNKPRGGNYHWIDSNIVRATRFKGTFTDLVITTREIEVFEDGTGAMNG